MKSIKLLLLLVTFSVGTFAGTTPKDNPTNGQNLVKEVTQLLDAPNFKIAKDIDEEYYKNYLIAKKAGVNFLAYRCKLNSKEIKIEKKLNIINE